MKICMVTYSYYFTDARIKGYVNHLARAGHQVDVLTLKEPHHKDKCRRISDRLSIYYLTDKYIGHGYANYLASYMKFFISAALMLTRLWTTRRYQVIHVNNIPNFIVFTTILPKIFGVKVILDMHDIVSQVYRDKFGDRKALRLLLVGEEVLSTLYADVVLCADDFQRSFLIDERKVPANKVATILNLPDTAIFRRAAKDRPEVNGIPINLIYHGTITRRLGIDIILKAVAKVKGTMKVRLFLYGNGDYMDDCLDLIKELGIGDIVYASRKFVNVEDLPELLAGMHLGVIGNRNSPAAKHMLPVKLMEYMALGIPVVVPDIPNIRHYFGADCVSYYKPEDIDDLSHKIIALAGSPRMRSVMADRALRYIESNNWEVEFGKYLRILERMIGK